MRRGSLLMTNRNGAMGADRPQLSYEELLRDNPKEMSMLDRALEYSTPEHKAQVRGLLMSYEYSGPQKLDRCLSSESLKKMIGVIHE